MRKKSFLMVILATLFVFCCQNFVSAQEKCPLQDFDIAFMTSPSNAYQTKMVESLIQTELFQKGFAKLTKKIDEEYEKNETKSDFPQKQANYILSQIAKSLNKETVSSGDIIRSFYEHVNAIFFLGNLNVAKSDDFDQHCQELSIDGAFVLIVDFNPSAVFDLEQILVKDSDYVVVQDRDGIFAIKNKKTIPGKVKNVVVGGTEIQNSGYFAIVLGEKEDLIMNTIQKFQHFEGLNVLQNQYPKMVKQLITRSTLFEKLSEMDHFSGDEKDIKKAKEYSALIQNVFTKIDSISHSIIENEQGEIIVSFQLTAKTEEDAQAFENIVRGGIALMKWNVESQKDIKKELNIIHGALDLIQINREAQTVTADLKINQDILKIAFDILKPELEQLKIFLDNI
ncbi:MAG: hypothetical protein Q4C95_04930 [Planctomycetia bacterium]|nr:hypothetical protein [Planctomycetia bacterium]